MTDQSLPKTLQLPYPPSANRLWSFVGGRRPIKTSTAKAYAEVVAWRAREAGWRPHHGPIGVEVVLHPLRPKKTRPGPDGGLLGLLRRVFLGDTRRLDLDNAIKATLDALNGTAWVDDSQVVVLVAWVGEPVPCGLVQVNVLPWLSDYPAPSLRRELTEGVTTC